ncbi:MAG TPA: phosphoribosylformylglycinamidine synthase subunit PurQ, partial [Candidatus Krumholzibacteria bacterium]|nr:phosphoribosylformylglycinamidine synthase subunit PurQ [Candidatus Krumholzibacteria bacterium]
VLEACRNVACVGGEPAAVTDCLNFGNPEEPEAFWQFAESVRGIGDACRGVGCYAREDRPLPVVSGNVSFYNQSSSGRAVAPSPIVACVGIVDDYARCRSQRLKDAGDRILLVGARVAEMAGSLYVDAGFRAGRPAVPPLEFAQEKREIGAVIALVRAGLVTAAHDISDGGLAVALTEMAMGLEAAGLRGAELALPDDTGLTVREFLFSESGGFVVTVAAADAEQAATVLDGAGARWWDLGAVTVDGRLTVAGVCELDVADLARRWQTALPRLMGGEAAVAQVPPAAKALTDAAPTAAPFVNLGRRPRVAVLQLPGVNCEEESARLLAGAGAEASIYRWTLPAADLAAFDGFLVPGGFSYQDRVRAGAVAAKDPLLRVLLEAAEAGKPVLGICNGCQVLVEAGLVPGRRPGAVEVALAGNRVPGRRGYLARWVAVAAHPRSRSPFVEGLTGSIPLPMAHAEGRFTHEDPAFFAQLAEEGHVALVYEALGGRKGSNPNGALLDAAGLTNARGNVLAMMPHPERAAQLRHVPEDLPHAWGRARRAAAGDFPVLESAGPGAFLLRRLVELC